MKVSRAKRVKALAQPRVLLEECRLIFLIKAKWGIEENPKLNQHPPFPTESWLSAGPGHGQGCRAGRARSD